MHVIIPLLRSHDIAKTHYCMSRTCFFCTQERTEKNLKHIYSPCVSAHVLYSDCLICESRCEIYIL